MNLIWMVMILILLVQTNYAGPASLEICSKVDYKEILIRSSKRCSDNVRRH